MTIIHSGLETDLRLAEALDVSLQVQLHDLASIRSTGAIQFRGTVNGSGSDTSRQRLAGLGHDHMESVAEDFDTLDTALGIASVDIAVVRNSLARSVSDTVIFTGFVDDINPVKIAGEMMNAYDGRFNDVAAAAVATAANNVGTSGVDMSTDDFFDAKFALQLLSVPGRYFCLLHPRQMADLEESIRSEAGPVQFIVATQEMLNAKGQGFQGSWLGIDIFASSDVSAAGGNFEGGMWGPGALAYKTGVVDARSFIGTSGVVVQQGEVLVEIGRIIGGGRVRIVGDAHFGISVIEQNRLVGIVTDQ